MPDAIRLTITGRVQGVFFRDWAVTKASTLGLAGWVRNRHDDSVEVHAEGDAAALAAFVKACHRGPDRAEVEHVEAREVADEDAVAFTRREDG